MRLLPDQYLCFTVHQPVICMSYPIYYLDTFTDRPFGGNPTAVVCADLSMQAETMQAIAAELNLPVTAFIIAKKDQPAGYSIRYFTPTTEIPACGHATLAAARVVHLREKSSSVLFETIQKKLIPANCTEKLITINYAPLPWTHVQVDHEVLQALGLTVYCTAFFSPELETLFIETENETILRQLQPDYPRLVKSTNHIKEVVVTCLPEGNGYDYVLCSFCPWIGIDEDHVTGSVQAVLAGYWKQRLQKNELVAWQASARGGKLMVSYYKEAVVLGGETALVMEGRLNRTLLSHVM
jgi:phenazine biosynthesis protein PhzF family